MIRDITIGQYYNVKSIVHDLDPRVKLFATLIFLISLFVSKSVYAYFIEGFFLFICIKLSFVPLKHMIKGLKPLLFLLLISVFFNLILTTGDIIYSFWIINITKEGIELAIRMGLRLVFLVLGSSLLTYTTTPNKLTDGIEKSFSFLKIFKIPVAEIALMMSIALRFIPILIEEVDKIMKAQMSRGADFDSGNIIEKGKALVPLLVPLFISAFRRADDLALAMESRCYTTSDCRTKYKPLKYATYDYYAYMILIIYLLIVFLTRFI